MIVFNSLAAVLASITISFSNPSENYDDDAFTPVSMSSYDVIFDEFDFDILSQNPNVDLIGFTYYGINTYGGNTPYNFEYEYMQEYVDGDRSHPIITNITYHLNGVGDIVYHLEEDYSYLTIPNSSCNLIISPIYYMWDTHESHCCYGNTYIGFTTNENYTYSSDFWYSEGYYYFMGLKIEIAELTQFSSDYNSGYQNGYDSGKKDGEIIGESNGYQEGYQDGSRVGYTTGYSTGYGEGISQSGGYSFDTLFATIADTPILMLRSLFSFELFGTTMLSVVLTLFSALLILYLLKKLLLK